MTTYRTDDHWGVTIVREGCPATGDTCTLCTEDVCVRHPSGRRDAQLAAVVVNGDKALAERICALLNAYQPSDCPRVGMHNCGGEWRNHDRYEPSQDAPSSPLSAPRGAEQPRSVGADGS